MSDYDLILVAKYRKAGVIVDTNLLLLYFVGLFDPTIITKFKRTDIFTQEDHLALSLFLKEFSKVITTPNILTEVNSFSNQLPNHIKPGYYLKFASEIATFQEIYTSSQDISISHPFSLFGLTDAGLFLTAKDTFLVLTDDRRLAVCLNASGVDAINFNHLRTYL
jgi:hypothetical protein